MSCKMDNMSNYLQAAAKKRVANILNCIVYEESLRFESFDCTTRQILNLKIVVGRI